MSSLKELSAKYPDALPPGISLQEASEVYLRLFGGKAKVYLEDTTLVVLQELAGEKVVRGWLLVNPFKKSTVTVMKKVVADCLENKITIQAMTEDSRMLLILQKLGFVLQQTHNMKNYLVLGE
jgi:hypothetical protein